jgi:hypothetical protein
MTEKEWVGMMGAVSLYREGSENIGRKYQRVSRSINYHKFASYTIVGVLQIIIKTENS